MNWEKLLEMLSTGPTMRAEAEARTPEYNAEILKTLFVPEDASELGLMAMAGPGGKLAKLGGLALAGGSYAPEAEAAWQKMMQLMYRGRSSKTPLEDMRALYMSPQRGYAEQYALRRARQHGGDATLDTYMVDPSQVERRGHNMLPESGQNMQSSIAYPKAGQYRHMDTETLRKALGGLIQAGRK